ncbi:LysE family translocator [Halomonas sp. C22]|uniref:LysE family translocator n=1 Tax=Halomonas sp. C22 TaxID=2580567 RepID=UPI0011A5B46A|nr:LysE family transporter [Halomonas sp. C22]
MLWASFLILTIGQVLSPGPTASLVIFSGLQNGFKSCLKIIPGIFLGDFFLMAISYFLIYSLTNHMTFINKYITLLGGGFLLLIGIKSLLELKKTHIREQKAHFEGSGFLNGFLITSLNPKGFIFFATVLPLFIVDNGSFLIQYMILCSIFLSISVSTDLLYAYLASCLGKKMPYTVQKAMLVATGLILLLTGIYFLTIFIGEL